MKFLKITGETGVTQDDMEETILRIPLDRIEYIEEFTGSKGVIVHFHPEHNSRFIHNVKNKEIIEGDI